MDLLLYRFRAELRSSWRVTLTTVIVLGLAGGLALAALGGARRTASAFPRLLADTNAGDVMVNPDYGTFSVLDHDAVLRLPEVEGGTFFGGVGMTTAAPDGGPDPDVDDLPMVLAVRGDGAERDRPKMIAGRLPVAADEALVSPSAAERLGVSVGGSLEMFVADFERLQQCEPEGQPCAEAFDPVLITIVGLGRSPDDVAKPFEEGRILLAGAFLDEHPGALFFWGGSYHLRPGADGHRFRATVSALAPDEPLAFETTSHLASRFQQSVRPQAIAVAAFGALVGAAALLFAVLGAVRQSGGFAADRRVLVAMGAGRRVATGLGALHGLSWALGGAVVALVVAVTLSPLTPIGPARAAEPNPGIALDWTVLVAGVLASVVALVAAGAGAAARAWVAVPPPGRVSRVATVVAATGRRLPAVVGAHLAFERGAGATAVPVRSTVATLAVATAAAVAAITFGAGLGHLLDTPSAHGANWDVTLGFTTPDFVASADEVRAAAAAVEADVDNAVADLVERDDVAGVSVLSFAALDVAGRAVAALGIEPRTGTAYPSLIEGRPPESAGEIVLGARTLRASGARLGGDVEVGGRPMRVVGQAVFPGYAEYPTQDPTDLGDAAWVTLDGLRAAGTVFSGRSVLVDLVDGTDAGAAFAGYQAPGLAFDGGVRIAGLRPSTVGNLERVRSTPVFLALALAAMGAVVAAHAVALSVRRRLPVIAVLRAIGFDRRQVAGTIAWQATWIALAAAAVGVPLGVVLGRWSWMALVRELGGFPSAVVPLVLVAAVAAGAVAVANLAALTPARRAVRSSPAAALRAE